jgi:HK97 family phage major capsid protein
VEEANKAHKVPNFNRIQKDPNPDNENNGVAPFKHWMATGQENDELIRPDDVMMKIPAAKAAWNVTTGGSGGFLVPDPLYNQIIAKRQLSSWIRQAPVQHFQTDADHLLVPQESTSHTSFVLTAEAGSYDENEGTVTQKDLILYKYTKLTKVNEEFLMYQTTNWESWFTGAMGRAVAATENTFSTSGNGTGQPEGLATGATASGLTIKTSAQLNPEDLTALIGKLGAGYNVTAECGFVGANASKWYIKNAILAGPFAYASNNGNQGAPDFFGYPWYISDDVQSYTATSGVVMYFGNLNYLGVVEKPGMMIQRNPYLYMATGQIGIFCNIFRGSGVLQSEAIYSVNGK